MVDNKKSEDKKSLCAICGLFCGACTLYIGTREDPERIKDISKRLKTETEEWECDGCRTDRLCYYCRNVCYMKPCATEKGIDFCYECEEYPCDEIRKFQEERPHRIELWEAQERIKKVGYSKWFDEMMEHYSCPDCHTINSAYDIACRNCGQEPSCKYVELHKDTIEKYL